MKKVTKPAVKKSVAKSATPKAPAKKTTKKAAPKKTTKKTTKATKTVAKKAEKKTPKANSSPLTKREVLVLGVLSRIKPPRGINRTQLNERTKTKGGWARLLGAVTREGLGVHGSLSLAGRGLIKIMQHESQRELEYAITAKGKQALAKTK